MNNLDMSGLCRCCLSNDSVQLNDLFKPNENIDLGEAIQAICGIDIMPNHLSLPDQICNECLESLEASYNFRIRTQQSDKTLNGILQGSIISKEYNIDVDQPEEEIQREPISAESEYQSDDNTTEAHSKDIPVIYDIDPNNESECPYCQKHFTHRKNLRTHVKRHFSEGKYKCYQCQNTYHTKFDLQRHMIKIHAEGVSFRCDLCDKEFPTKPELNRHVRLHDQKKTYACTKCGMEFKLKHNAQQHFNSHEKKMPFSCLVCGKNFAFACKLKNHNKFKCQPLVHISVAKDVL